MNYSNKNMRGFTLIELLAVIVVLAIVMLIAVNAVMPQLNEARKRSFAIEANGAIEAAMSYFLNNSLLSTDGAALPAAPTETNCVTIQELVDGGYSELNPSTYSGRVVVKMVGNYYVYSVSLKNAQYMVVNRGYESANDGYNKDVTASEVSSLDVNVWKAENASKLYECPSPRNTKITFPAPGNIG